MDNKEYSQTPIIVYQMGKVGSASVQHSLLGAYRSLGIDIPVHHIHNLHKIDEMYEKISKKHPDWADTLKGLELGIKLKKEMDESPEKKFNLVSLVRDPIERNISSFFHAINQLIPDWKNRFLEGSGTIEELQDIFLTEFQGHYASEVWFDNQMKPVFNIDVYASSFPKKIGYKIYDEDYQHAKLLLIRLEDLNRVAKEAFGEYLGLENFEIINANIGQNKEYAPLYRSFKKTPLPKTYIEERLNSKFSKHFYLDDEINQFIEKWSSPRNNDSG